MGIYTRPDSPWYWLWLETAPIGQQKEKTRIKVGTTATQRHDSRQLADQLYHQRMNEIATQIHHLPRARPALRFETYAETYRVDTIAHHRGAARERELLTALLKFFGADLLTAIDRDRVKAYYTFRRRTASARTTNREVDLLKSMIRDAVPKYLASSPIAGLAKLPIVAPKRRLLQPAEERRLLPKLAVDDRAIVLMGLDTLVRLGDILDLRREDDHGRTLYIRDPKDPTQATPYEVPVSTRLRRALNAVPKSDSAYYFPRRRQAATEKARGMVIRSALRRACEAAGLDYGRKKGGITFHWGTRRTGASRMIQRHVDIKTVQAVGHWKHPDVVLEIYAEATTAAMRRAVEVVSQRPGRSRSTRR